MTKLYEHGTLAMLMDGMMDGTMTLADLMTHGDTGIGTLTGTNGELTILDGEVYHAKSDGEVVHITDLTVATPFSSVHFNEPTVMLAFDVVDAQSLTAHLGDHDLANVFSGIKLHGTFQHIHVRVAKEQSQPYPSLLDVAEGQAEFQARDITGTLVGYYAPEIFAGPTTAGWHIHFISDDKQFAGHVLDFSASQLKGSLQIFDDFVQHLPVDNQSFRKMKQNMNGLKENIAKSEGGHH